jgi:prepilin-type N-terminal cleavage/methylation domain-containing protein
MILLSDKKGFTLMELLIGLAVFALLCTFLVASYHNNEKAQKLKDRAQNLVLALQKVQNMALTGQEVNGLTPARYEFSISNCEIGSCSYSLLADGSVFSDVSLSDIGIGIKSPASSPLIVAFSPPRGNMSLSASANTAAFDIFTEDASLAFCLDLNAISGRINLSSIACP